MILVNLIVFTVLYLVYNIGIIMARHSSTVNIHCGPKLSGKSKDQILEAVIQFLAWLTSSVCSKTLMSFVSHSALRNMPQMLCWTVGFAFLESGTFV